MFDDQAITDEIRAKLAGDPHINNAKEVAVATRAGTVILRGTVRSLHQRRMVVEIANSVRGVREIEDELKVDPRDQVREDELRGAVLQALMDDGEVPDHRVEVAVSAGWVTLTGEVRHQAESDAAFDVVSRLEGVGGITNKIVVVTARVQA